MGDAAAALRTMLLPSAAAPAAASKPTAPAKLR